MKIDTVFVSAPYELNKGIRADFPFLTFGDNDGVMMNVVNDLSTIDGIQSEIKEIKARLNSVCNKYGMALKDVEFKLKWHSRG